MSRTIRYGLCVVLIAFALTLTPPRANAATASVGAFFGGCNSFSVNVAVTGTQDNGGGMDRIRLSVLDGGNNVLYSEDASVKNGTTVGSLVVDFPYSRSASTNPIRFSVINLDNAGNATGEIGANTFVTPCLAPAGTGASTGFSIPRVIHGAIPVTTVLHDSPNGRALDLVVAAGKIHNAVYRNATSDWVAIHVGGNNLVWIPASSILVDVNQLAFRPSFVFGSSLGAGANSGSSGGGTGTGTTVRAQLNLRAGASTSFAILTKIPRNSAVTVLGRNQRSTWLKITFNNVTGWVSRTYVNITAAAVKALPVVQ